MGEYFDRFYDQPWCMDFEDICAGIALEFGDILVRGGPYTRYTQAERTLMMEGLRKYYREECSWGFEEVAGVMIDNILNELTK